MVLIRDATSQLYLPTDLGRKDAVLPEKYLKLLRLHEVHIAAWQQVSLLSEIRAGHVRAKGNLMKFEQLLSSMGSFGRAKL